MKKIYSFLKGTVLFSALLLTSSSLFAQSICGPVVEEFTSNTGGFTGSFTYASSGGGPNFNGFLRKTNVQSRTVYTVSSRTFQLPNNATSLGVGFTLSGTTTVASAVIRVVYRSSITGELVTGDFATITPGYTGNGSNQVAVICTAVQLTALPGLTAGSTYRFVIELSTNTGTGAANETLTFDDFRTNGGNSQIPLPVTFIGFEAKNTNGSVQLTWRVAGEENVVRYEVEKSEDGRTFSRIGSVLSSGSDTYTFTDPNSTGTAYYRVKNVDGDGKFKFSTIARIANGMSEIVLRGFPQPVQSLFTLQHPVVNGRALINLSTADGRIIKSITPPSGSMQTPVDMSNLQPGMYMLRFNSGNGETQTLKIIKQ